MMSEPVEIKAFEVDWSKLSLSKEEADLHAIKMVTHDGNLDEHGDARVFWGYESVCISHSGNSEVLRLPPSYALSLLNWLKQEQPKLELLVKEQA